jgi:Tol biopolymer transport system component
MSPDDCRIQPATKLDSARYDYGHQWPYLLPDGRHFLYSGVRTDKRHDVLLGTLGSFDNEVLVHNASDPKYAPPGYLFFERNGYLFAQPFSLSTFKVSGEPVQVEADQLMFAGLGGIAHYDVVPGVLVFEKQQDVRNQLKIIDATGKQIEALDVPGSYSGMRVSADRTKLLVSKMNLQFHSSDLWAYDLNHHNFERFTFDSSIGDHLGVWSPDGQMVIYSVFTRGHENLYRKTRSGEAQVLLEDNFDKQPTDWSSDGRFLLFVKASGNGAGDLWVYPLQPEGKPYPIAETRFNEANARFSPDIRWIAYNTDESGQGEVYVRPFPGPGERQQISTGGGRLPHWSRDGRKLFFETLNSRLMEVPVTATGSAFRTGSARVLSVLPKDSELEPFSDGRFLLNEQIGKLGSLPIVTLNWEAALSKAKK